MAEREIEANPDSEKRGNVRKLLPEERNILEIDEAVVQRADALCALGFDVADAAHIAAAEVLNADVLLTCDDQMLRLARRNNLSLKLANPLTWLREQKDV